MKKTSRFGDDLKEREHVFFYLARDYYSIICLCLYFYVSPSPIVTMHLYFESTLTQELIEFYPTHPASIILHQLS